MIITVLVADQISSHVLKPLVERLRPCNQPMWSHFVRTLIHCGSGYSFPSSHATNHFAIAIFLMFSFRKNGRYLHMSLLFVWASLISIGQVYVGVHYPLDIITGCLLGSSIGILIALSARKMINLRI
jgi:membrane-associated phospholipid phosphatase